MSILSDHIILPKFCLHALFPASSIHFSHTLNCSIMQYERLVHPWSSIILLFCFAHSFYSNPHLLTSSWQPRHKKAECIIQNKHWSTTTVHDECRLRSLASDSNVIRVRAGQNYRNGSIGFFFFFFLIMKPRQWKSDQQVNASFRPVPQDSTFTLCGKRTLKKWGEGRILHANFLYKGIFFFFLRSVSSFFLLFFTFFLFYIVTPLSSLWHALKSSPFSFDIAPSR